MLNALPSKGAILIGSTIPLEHPYSSLKMMSPVAYHLDNIATFQSCRLNIKGKNYKPVNIQLVTDDTSKSIKKYTRGPKALWRWARSFLLIISLESHSAGQWSQDHGCLLQTGRAWGKVSKSG